MSKHYLKYCVLFGSLALVSCKSMLKPSPELMMSDVSIYADSDVNNNSAIASDLVIVYNEDLMERIGKMSACRYFASVKQLLLDNPSLLDIWHWEFIPGQSVQNFTVCQDKGKAFGAYIFANYLTPGEHRIKVAPDGVVIVRLKKDDLQDLSAQTRQDIRYGATMATPENLCGYTEQREYEKWPSLIDAITTSDTPTCGLRQGPAYMTPVIRVPQKHKLKPLVQAKPPIPAILKQGKVHPHAPKHKHHGASKGASPVKSPHHPHGRHQRPQRASSGGSVSFTRPSPVQVKSLPCSPLSSLPLNTR